MPQVKHHKRIPKLSEKDIERFWSKVDRSRPDKCWPWMAGRYRKGYGQFAAPQRVDLYAHRVAYYLSTGVDPAGMLVCHTCNFPPCCRPDHLYLGTDTDNMRKMVEDGRHYTWPGLKNWRKLHPEHTEKLRKWAKEHPEARQGERNGNAKLTWEQVCAMREEYRRGGISQPQLARKYGIGKSQAGNVVTHKSWPTGPSQDQPS